MSIKERISKIEKYFKEMQIVTIDGKQVMYVIVNFPYGWVIDEDIETKFNVTVSTGEYNGEFYFCSEIDNGEESVFDAIEYNIEKMKEAIERAQLLTEKTKELKRIFEDESIGIAQLRELKLIFDKEEDIVLPKKKDKNNEKNNDEINENADE